MGGSPRPALDKQGRQALLAQLAAKRQQKASGNFRNELEDSDSGEGSDDDSFATARSRQPLALDDSSDDENQRPGVTTSRSDAAAGGKLNRLRKAGAAPRAAGLTTAAPKVPQDVSDDDIAAQLGGLTLRGGKAAARGTGGDGDNRKAARAAAPVPPPRPKLDLGRSQPSQPDLAKEAQPQRDMQQDSNCLVLGEKGEFRLK